MFRKWFRLHERCAVCDLEIEGKPGDQWGFWVFTDRIFLFGALAVLYLGFTPESLVMRVVLFVGVAGPLILTMPHRQGAFVALDYLSRTRWSS